MKRILISLIAVAVIAAGGWFGFNRYVQHRTTAEVEAAFERIRTGGGKASHGKVAFDLWSRTLTIDDIAVEPNQSPKAGLAINGIKIASFKASGVSQATEGRFSADAIDVSGAELTVEGSGLTKMAYKVPTVTLRDYSGPIRAQLPPSNSLLDMYRYALEQLASVNASSMVAPTVAVTIKLDPGGLGDGEITYSGLDVRNIHGGKIDSAKLDRAVFTFDAGRPSTPNKFTGEISNINVLGFDATAATAFLDPQRANDDSLHQVYRHVSMGPYTITPARGGGMRIDRMAIDDVRLQPSKVLPFVMLVQNNPSALDAPVPSSDVLDKLLKFYEGIQVGKFELAGLSINTPQGPGKLDAIRYDQNEFAIEGFDTPTPEGRAKLERFALKSFRLTDLIRSAMQLSAKPVPSPDQMLGLFRVLDSMEIKGVVVPAPGGGMRIDRMTVDDVRLAPSEMQPFLMLVQNNPSALQAPVPSLDVLDKALKFYESMQVGKYELSGLSVDTPQGSGKLGAIRYDQNEFAIEGVDVSTPEGRAKLERFALKSFHLTDLMRWGLQLVSAKPPPSPDLFRVHDGIEIKGVAVSYTIAPAQRGSMGIDKIAVDAVRLDPSKMQPLLTLLQNDPSALQAPEPSPDVLEKMLKFYDGMRGGQYEISGLSMDTPQGSGKLDTIRYDESGYAIEGFDATFPEGRAKMERFALKSFNRTELLRWAIQLSAAKPTPSPDQMFGLFRVLDGIEIKGVVVPYIKKEIRIDAFNLNWGQFVGPIPSKINLTSKMAFPTDQDLKPLLAAGMDTLALNADFGATWTEPSSTVVLAPANIDIANILKAQTRVTLANVPRAAFSSDPAQAAQIEAGAIEFTLHDTGGVNLGIAEFARAQELDRDAARRAIVDLIKKQGEAASNPDAAAAIDAIVRFVETPGQTLVIKLTPLGKVPAMQLLDLLKSDPPTALMQFRIEASTGK